MSGHQVKKEIVVFELNKIGCVIAEMVLGEPIFCGESALDQLAEIIKVLGTPTQEQILQMNNSSEEVKLPKIKAKPWNKVFPAIIEKNIKLFIRF